MTLAPPRTPSRAHSLVRGGLVCLCLTFASSFSCAHESESPYIVDRFSFHEHGKTDRYLGAAAYSSGSLILHTGTHIVEHDGYWWDVHAAQSGLIHQIATGLDGHLYGCGPEWMGILGTDSSMGWSFFENFGGVNDLKNQDPDFGVCHDVVPSKQGVYGIFETAIYLFHYPPSSIKDFTIRNFSVSVKDFSHTKFPLPPVATGRGFMVGDRLHVEVPGQGLIVLQGETFEPVDGSTGLGADPLLGFHPNATGGLVVGVNGLYPISADGLGAPLSTNTTPTPETLGERTAMLTLGEEGFIIGFSSGQVAHYSSEGNFIEAIPVAPASVTALTRDHGQGLWVATMSGAYRVNFPGPVRRFPLTTLGLSDIGKGSVSAGDDRALLTSGNLLHELTIELGKPVVRPIAWAKDLKVDRFALSSDGIVAATDRGQIVHVDKSTGEQSVLRELAPDEHLLGLVRIGTEPDAYALVFPMSLTVIRREGGQWVTKGPFTLPQMPIYGVKQLTPDAARVVVVGGSSLTDVALDAVTGEPTIRSTQSLDDAMIGKGDITKAIVFSRLDDDIVLTNGATAVRQEGTTWRPLEAGLPPADQELNAIVTIGNHRILTTARHAYLQSETSGVPPVSLPTHGIRTQEFSGGFSIDGLLLLPLASEIVVIDPQRVGPPRRPQPPIARSEKTLRSLAGADLTKRTDVESGRHTFRTWFSGDVVDVTFFNASLASEAELRYRVGDDEWSAWTNKRTITPPLTRVGDIKLEVESRLVDAPGVTGNSFDIKLLPQWHQRWDVRAALGLGVLMLFGGLIQAGIAWRTRGHREQLRQLEALAARRASEIAVLSPQQTVDATRDPATNLPNRVAFERAFERESLRSKEFNYPLAVVMIELGSYRSTIEEQGYAQADALLSSAASILSTHTRPPSELLARLSGGGFACLIPNVDESQANIRAKAMKDSLTHANIVAAEAIQMVGAMAAMRTASEVLSSLTVALQKPQAMLG